MTGHGCRVQNATVRTTAEASIPVESPPRQPQVRSGCSDQGGLTFSNVPEPESLRKPLSGCPVSCRDGAPFRIDVPSASLRLASGWTARPATSPLCRRSRQLPAGHAARNTWLTDPRYVVASISSMSATQGTTASLGSPSILLPGIDGRRECRRKRSPGPSHSNPTVRLHWPRTTAIGGFR